MSRGGGGIWLILQFPHLGVVSVKNFRNLQKSTYFRVFLKFYTNLCPLALKNSKFTKYDLFLCFFEGRFNAVFFPLHQKL